MITDVLTGLCAAFWAGLFLWVLGAWARHAWRSPAYRPHAATVPTVSACLCAATCHARPCLTYTKEHAYR